MPFPINPTNGQQTTINGVVYTYNSTLTAWTVTSSGGSLTSASAVSVGGNVTANSFNGAGTGLTGTASGLTVGTATTAGTVTTAAQPAITSVGTLTSLNTTGAIGAGGSITANAASGRASLGLDSGGSLSLGLAVNNPTDNSPYIDFNTSATVVDYDVRIQATGNTATVGGGTLTFSASNVIASSNLSATGNITGGNVLTSGIISATGNVTGNNFIGRLANGTSNIAISTANGNIIFNVNGVSGPVDITQYGIEANTILLGNLTGQIPTAYLTLPAANGAAGITAVKFTPGTFADNPQAGSLNFDGNVFRMTAAAGNESVTMNSYFYRTNANITLANASTAQAWLGVGVTLQANTVYQFNGLFNLVTTGTTSHTEAIGMGGTATLFNIGYHVTRANANAITATSGNTYITYRTSNASVVQTGAFTTAQNVVYTINGTVSTNAGGTFIPQLTFSAAPAGTSTVTTGAYFQITALQGGNGNVNIGTWA